MYMQRCTCTPDMSCKDAERVCRGHSWVFVWEKSYLRTGKENATLTILHERMLLVNTNIKLLLSLITAGEI